MTPRQQALAYFCRQGWSVAQSAGIVANLEAESGLRPDAVGDGGAAFGIAQWHPPRQTNFAALMGRDIRGSSLEDQLAFVHAELQRWEAKAGDALRDCTTAAAAAEVICRLYERPADTVAESQKRARLAERIFHEFDGTEQPAPAAPVATPKGGAMGALALLQMFGPVLSGLIPQIATILKPGSEVAQRNVDLAQVLVDTINKAAAHPTLQGSVEAMQADPAVRAAVQQAVVTEPAIMDTLQIGPSDVGGARKANAELMAAMASDPWYVIIVKTVFNPVFLVTLAVLPIIYMIVNGLLPFLAKVSGDVIAQTIGTVIGLILGGIMGFWTGQTYTQSNQRRQDAPK